MKAASKGPSLGSTRAGILAIALAELVGHSAGQRVDLADDWSSISVPVDMAMNQHNGMVFFLFGSISCSGSDTAVAYYYLLSLLS